MAGQRQKPTELLTNQRGGRDKKLTVIRALKGDRAKPPSPPVGLSEYAAAVWGDFWRSDVALAVDMLSERDNIEHWIRCVDERNRLWDIVRKTPLVKGSHGQLMVNPLQRRIRELTTDIDRASAVFGLGPLWKFRLQLTVSEASRSANDLLRELAEMDEQETDDIIDGDAL